MHAIVQTDALLARMSARVAAIQLVRYRKTSAVLTAASIVGDMVGDGEGESSDGSRPALRILLTSREGHVVDQCDLCPVDGHAVLVAFDRCLRAAWHWKTALALDAQDKRLESWDPRHAFGADPTAIHVGWARQTLAAAGYAVEVGPGGLAIRLHRNVKASAIDVALTAPAAAVASLKEAGLSLSALKARVRGARAEAEKGVDRRLEIVLDRAELRWEREERPASDALSERARREHGVVRREHVAALSYDGWEVLRAFGWGGHQDIPLFGGKDEGRAIKQLLAAYAAGLPV